MVYRVVYWLLSTALTLGFIMLLIAVAGSNTSIWVMVPVFLVYIFIPKEWLAENISRQPRVDPWGRRGNAAER
jgi:hypothetical protein